MAGLLNGKVVLVNGGTQGVGAAVARTAVREGAAVVVTGRRTAAGERFVDELADSDVRFFQADLADVDAARAAVTATVTLFGRIDCLCNAAGLSSRGTLLDTTPELFDQHIAVNLRAPFFAMQAAVKNMLDRKEPGSIVNIISIAAHGGQPYLSSYSASKAGLAGLTRNAAYAHRWDRIRINGINLGWTETEGETAIQQTFHGASADWASEVARSQPMGKLVQVDEIAELVVFLLSDHSGVVTGSIIDWDQIVIGGQE